MTQHLREDEYSSILAGDARQEWLRHIKECPECARTLEQGQNQIEQIRSLMVNAGARSETYWTAQHARIQARIASDGLRSTMPVWRFAMAGLALAAIIVVALLMGHPQQTASPGKKDVIATVHPTDEQLMREMEEVADSEVPSAMEPAYVLTQDMEYHAASNPSQLHETKITSRHNR